MEFTAIAIYCHILGTQWSSAVASDIYSMVTVVSGVGKIETLVKLSRKGVEYFV
jgi:hypothetical protein